MRAIPHYYISGNISSPIKCKERFCDSVSFGIIPSSVQKCLLSFKEENEWISSLAYLFSLFTMKDNKKFSNELTRNISELTAFKFNSNVVTKETSQILLQRLWHLRKPQITLVSLWGDSFTDVGYNIGQVETLLGCSYRYHCVFWTGLLSTPTAAI